MAGNKIEMSETDSSFGTAGLPLAKISVNVEPDDEWALLRLTDDGYSLYQEGPDFRATILSVEISGKPAYKEVARRKTRGEVEELLKGLPEEERKRTLLRPVRPK